jgi:hypothetical protein
MDELELAVEVVGDRLRAYSFLLGGALVLLRRLRARDVVGVAAIER